MPQGNAIVLNLELDINGILKVTAIEKCSGLTKAVTLDTKNVKPHLDIAEAQKTLHPCCRMRMNTRMLKLSTLSKTPPAANRANNRSLPSKGTPQARGKLLGSIAEEDAKDIRDMLEKNREAINTGDMKRLAETNTSLEDIIFYLED